MKNILITGRPGIGKTTIIKKIADRLSPDAGGFYTEEIREGKGRVGFSVRDLDGREGILSHLPTLTAVRQAAGQAKDIRSNCRVGKYYVDVKGFEKVAIPALRGALKEKRFIVVDEIGPMEEYSREFRSFLEECLNSKKCVIATIKEKGSSFVQGIRDREDSTIFNVSMDNRDMISEEILSKILKW